MATSLVTLLILALLQLHLLLLSHRSLWDRHCLIGLDELSIDKVELVIDFLTCNWNKVTDLISRSFCISARHTKKKFRDFQHSHGLLFRRLVFTCYLT